MDIKKNIDFLLFCDTQPRNKQELYYIARDVLPELIASHPNSLSLVGHTHRHYHHLIGKSHTYRHYDFEIDDEDDFPGCQPHHMVSIGAVCGAWWSGAPDEYGIPHAMMTDGTVLNREKGLGDVPWRIPGSTRVSEQLWESKPGYRLSPGAHTIYIRAQDDWWDYEGKQIIYIW